MASLVLVDGGNCGLYAPFIQVYETQLRPYMSRIYPHGVVDRQGAIDPVAVAEARENRSLCWWYIVEEGRPIGSIWLEKAAPKDWGATLGVFLLEEGRSRGLGRWAVLAAVEAGERFLHVGEIHLRVRAENQRAYDCYKSCGFVETGRFRKEGPPPYEVVAMSRRIKGKE